MSIFKKMILGVSSILLVSQGLHASSKEQRNLLNLGSVQNKNFISTIPMKFAAGIPLVDVEINGKKYKFMFDTGAFTVIPKKLVEELQLELVSKEINIIDAAGEEDTLKLYRLPSLSMGGIVFDDFSVAAEDFAHEFPNSCLGFDGIIGYNFLRNLVLKMDYEEEKIYLSDRQIAHRGYVATNIKFETRYAPMVHFDFGFTDVWLGLDSGKNDGILIGEDKIIKNFSEEGYQSRKIEGIFSSTFTGVGENRIRETFVVQNFKLAKKIKIASFPIDVDDSGQFLVGNDFLKNFHVIVDFKRKKAYFKPLLKEPLHQGFDDDFGLSFFYHPQKSLFVSAIEESSPASRAGLQIGDKVLELDGVDTYNFMPNDFCRLILTKRYENLQNLDLVIRRDTATILKRTLKK